MENGGLYGQSERGNYFAERAFANRIGDVESETGNYGIPSEHQYRLMMADSMCKQICAANKQHEAEEFLSAPRKQNDPMGDFLIRAMYEAIEMSPAQQTEALAEIGDIAEQMYQHEYSRQVIYNAISASTPIAFHKLKEIRTKSHPSAQGSIMKKRGKAQIAGARLREKYGM